MSGKRESELIRLSVRPSLRYSLFASEVAFTKGNTAIEPILLAALARCQKYVPATAATIRTPTIEATRYFLEIGAAVTLGVDPEAGDAGLGATVALEPDAVTLRPESKSRFNRLRS